MCHCACFLFVAGFIFSILRLSLNTISGTFLRPPICSNNGGWYGIWSYCGWCVKKGCCRQRSADELIRNMYAQNEFCILQIPTCFFLGKFGKIFTNFSKNSVTVCMGLAGSMIGSVGALHYWLMGLKWIKTKGWKTI